MTYTDVVNEAKDKTYEVVSDLKQLLSTQDNAESVDDDNDTVVVPRKKLKEMLAAAKLGNKSVSKVHRFTQAEIHRSNFEKAILRNEAIKDTADREASFTHTLSVIQELEGMGNSVNQGSKIATQINYMLGGLTSPPSLHFFDAALAAYVQEHDLINYAKSPSGPAFEDFLYQFSGAYQDKTIAPGSLAASVLFVPQHNTEPEETPDPLKFVATDSRSQETINADFADFMHFAARRTLEHEKHNRDAERERQKILGGAAASSSADAPNAPSAPGEGVHLATAPRGAEEMRLE